MNLFGGKGSALAKALGTTLMLVVTVRVSILLAAPANQYSLFWPVGGVALLCVYYWNRPALAGVLLASLAYNAATADWRWFTREARSPWYPSARLVRQPRPDAWKEVVEEVVAALRS